MVATNWVHTAMGSVVLYIVFVYRSIAILFCVVFCNGIRLLCSSESGKKTTEEKNYQKHTEGICVV